LPPLAAAEVEAKQSLCELKRLDFGVAGHAADELHLDMLVAAGEEVVEVSWSPKSQKSRGIAMML
jgi:hypothetical protein